ncbi:MAG TPA: YgiQ family radical SAM protein, partial [Lachnospiraceae bacterium]|nr:YgiQ family radical SAM protein [Lachnospiraceae bacterium]
MQRQPGRERFLPVTRRDMEERGILQPDFVYVIGDAYVDHPSFGPALLSRLLERYGFHVCILAQPDWRKPDSVTRFGEPRLGFLVSAGNMDSMVNHYSVSKKRRKTDAYSPGGVMGLRPDRAAMVYCNLIRSVYKKTPIIAGGIEASLRRMAHYDYWSDSLRRSLLMDCGADLISYGMGEHSIVEIAQALDAGLSVQDLTFIAGTCYRTKDISGVRDCVMLPAYEQMRENRLYYAASFYEQYRNTDPFNAKTLIEPYGSVFVVQNPPAKPLTQQEMDDLYALPYARTWHPDYDKEGGIPAFSEVKFSITSNRGCFGACNFCALNFHQGRIIQARSDESILEEAKLLTRDPEFKGYIHDVGGPTANFHQPSCKKQLKSGTCKDRQCLFPRPCPNLVVDHSGYTGLLQKLRALDGVKKVFVRSGVRFDYVMLDEDDSFLQELVRYHISGQLKVAPEHVSESVLRMLGKPPHSVYTAFARRYNQMNQSCGMDQYLVPYLISSHPGCTMKDAVQLAEYLRDIHHQPEQVQDFYPTPSTLSTVMYYTGVDPRTLQGQDIGSMKKVYVPKDPHEKAMQRALMQFRNPKLRPLVEEALRSAHREDLIGYGPKCLIRPSGGQNTSAAGRRESAAGRKDRKKGYRESAGGREDRT